MSVSSFGKRSGSCCIASRRTMSQVVNRSGTCVELTVFDRQGSTILQQTVATSFSNHALTSCDCAKLHELAKFWHPQGNSGKGTPNPSIQRQQHTYPSVHCSNIAQCLLPFTSQTLEGPWVSFPQALPSFRFNSWGWQCSQLLRHGVAQSAEIQQHVTFPWRSVTLQKCK